MRTGSSAARCPAAAFLRARLHGEPPGVYELIGPTFAELANADDSPTRAARASSSTGAADEIDLLLPI